MIKSAIDLFDLKPEDVAGKKWRQIEFDDVQHSAVITIMKPSTIHQGDTTTCGAICVLEAMAYFRPKLYSKLVLAVYLHGQIRTHDGHPWGDTPDLKPALLDASPPDSIDGRSVADWMVATSMIAELKDISTIRDLLDQDDYLGQDARSPDGSKTVDHARGLTFAWDVKKFMIDLLGCASVDRSTTYWLSSSSLTDRMIELTSSGALESGSNLVICLIDDTAWEAAEYTNPENVDRTWPKHWVRVRSVVQEYPGHLTIDVFSFGSVQTRSMTKNGWQRLYFETLIGTL